MGGKKKLTKKEKLRLEAERAETLRIEQEKERQIKLEEERERKLLERAEAEKRQKQEIEENKFRRIQLSESSAYFNNIQNVIDSIFCDVRKQREWKIYMRCNGLPNTYDPGDLRKYIHMWMMNSELYNKNERNWLLVTNEWSVLTQDQRISDMSRANLKKQQKNLGDLYANRIREVLGILNEIEEAILDNNTLSKSIRNDLHNLKYEFRTTLANYIDEYSFKILSNIGRDMDLEGLLIAKHEYQSDILKAQLWTVREAPQAPLNPKEKLKLETNHTEIDFPLLDVIITLPPSIKCKDSAVRVLWQSYDHFSDYCFSFNIPNRPPHKVLDISEATRKEWKKRKEFLKSSLVLPLTTNAKKKDSVISAMDEKIQDSGIVDVDKLYLEYENDLAQHERTIKGPGGLQLKQFDMNLRKHRIVAGVYCIEQLEQPQQDIKLNSTKYLRSLIYPNKLMRKPFHQTYKPPPPVLPGVRRLPEEIEAEVKEMEANLDKLASINIKLPEDIIWFEPPTVCRWETAEETTISEQLDRKNGQEITSSKCSLKQNKKQQVVIEDFNILVVPPNLDMYCLIQEFVIPRIPNGYIVKMGTTEVIPKNFKNGMNDLQIIQEGISSDYIKESLLATNSPRPLFPKTIINRELNLMEPVISIGDKHKQQLNKDGDMIRGKNVYMFSQLLKDLDELCELQTPYLEQYLDEISENLSISNEEMQEEEETVDTEQDFCAISFLRNNDYTFGNFGRKEEIVQPVVESSSSEDEHESSVPSNTDNNKNDYNDKQIGKWSNRDVHDIKYNEEKLSIQFKVGRLGYFALAINWYSNLPFQTWELRPGTKESNLEAGVIFSLTAAVVSIELTILSNGIILNSFQGGISPIVQNVVGQIMSFDEIKLTLARAAINLFPEDDAFCYCEGTCEKNAVMESHLYICMSSIALTHNFSWSRWNLLSGRRSCVLLIREIIENRKIPNYSTLHVTPLKACIVDCTDVSPSFNPTGIDGMEFYADLHNLSQVHSQAVSLEKHKQMDAMLRNNVIQVLNETRPLSFS